MDPNPLHTCHDRAVMALSETRPDLARVLRAVGANGIGESLVGLLGWLPDDDLVEVCQAVIMGHRDHTGPPWDLAQDTAGALAAHAVRAGSWTNPQSDLVLLRLGLSVQAYIDAGHPSFAIGLSDE